MSSFLCSQGVVLATAMAVSSTIIFFALRKQKPLSPTQFAAAQDSSSLLQNLPSCISSDVDEKKRERVKKKKKKVHFADDIIKACGANEEFGNEDHLTAEFKRDVQTPPPKKCRVPKMPANQLALYKGILRDRPQRMA